MSYLKLFYNDVCCCDFSEQQQQNKCPYTGTFMKDFYEKHYVIGFTINFPRVKIFNKATSKEAERMYALLLHDSLKKLEKDFLCQYIVKYELCRDSKTHCHGIIYFSKDIKKILIAGLLHDICSVVHQVANKALKRNNVNNPSIEYNDKFKRIESPMLVLQYMNDFKEFDRWIKYMYKQQDDSNYIGQPFIVKCAPVENLMKQMKQ